MTVLGLCHVCSRPTSAHCGLCGKATCSAHLTQVSGMSVCPSCLMKFRGDREIKDKKFMG